VVSCTLCTVKQFSEYSHPHLFPGLHSNVILTVDDCFDMAKTAYNDADYYHAVLWMQQALKQLDTGEEAVSSKADALDYLSYSVYQMGDVPRAIELTRRLVAIGIGRGLAGGLQHNSVCCRVTTHRSTYGIILFT